MALENELSLLDYLFILKRRRHLLLLIALPLILLSFAAAFLLPKSYFTSGTISVESQRILPDVVKEAQVSLAEARIDKIKQRALSKNNLLKIIQKYKLYTARTDRRSLLDAVDKMRKNITLTLMNADYQDPSGQRETIAFVLGFEYSKPDISYKVTNELITLFLDENAKAKTERATETNEFLTAELDRLKSELELVENKVAAYKQQHANSLPEHMEMHMAMLQRADADIKELDRDYKNTQEEIRYLDVELSTTKASVKNNAGVAVVGGVSDLEKAKAELERSLVLYKETHPTIRALKRKVELLEKAAEAPEPAEKPRGDITTELAMAKIQTQIEAAKVRLNSLSEQRKSLVAKMSQLQSQVTLIPQVERGLFNLMRDYENAKVKYEEVKSKQVNAKIAENLELENKTDRFTLIDPPVFPDRPNRPNKKKIIMFGFFASIVSALGIVVLLELLDQRVRGVEAITAITKIRPLIVLPYITTTEELKRNKNLTKLIFGFVAMLAIIVAYVHFVVMPLDLLVLRFM